MLFITLFNSFQFFINLGNGILIPCNSRKIKLKIFVPPCLCGKINLEQKNTSSLKFSILDTSNHISTNNCPI